MVFTENDRTNLAVARNVVAELEAKEREAINAAAGVLINAGLRLAHDSTSWGDIVLHADAIRDALKPFDSGVRCKDEAA